MSSKLTYVMHSVPSSKASGSAQVGSEGSGGFVTGGATVGVSGTSIYTALASNTNVTAENVLVAKFTTQVIFLRGFTESSSNAQPDGKVIVFPALSAHSLAPISRSASSLHRKKNIYRIFRHCKTQMKN